jgi:hypothetical protein
MKEQQSKLGVMFAIAIFVVVIAFLASGFIGLVNGNCWDNYETEEQAIINCEGGNE